MFNKQKEKFALRKLTVGLASVLIGISFISAQNCEVKADTINDTETARTTSDQTTTQPVQDANVVQAIPAENKPTDSVDVTTPAKIVQETTSQTTTTPEKQETNQTKTMDANKQNFEPKQLSPENKQDAISENVKQAGANRKTAMLYTVKKRTAMTANMTNVSKIGETTAIKDYTPDVKSWKGQVVSNKDLDGITRTYYELTDYTPANDSEKATIIIPNQDDFTKAGINIGYQTMIKSDTIKNLNKTLKPEEWHFSDTNEKKTKLMGVAGTYNDNIQNKEIPCQYSAGGLFYGSLNLKAVTGNGLDTSNVNNLSGAFSSDNKLVDISGVSNWDVSNVLSLANLFTNDGSLSSLDALINWNTSKNTSLESAFAYMPSLKSIEGLRNWDTSNVTNMRAVFQAEYTRNVDLPDPRGTKVSWSNYDLPTRWTSNLKDYSPLSNWNTSNVRDMSMMFQSSAVSDATFLTNWDTHNVENIYAMFMLNNLSDVTPFAKWNLTGIKNHAINEVFRDNMITDLTPLRNWNVSQGENLSCTFNSNNIRYADFTQIKAGHTDVGSQRINRGIIVVKDIPDNVDMMKEDGDNDLSDQLRYYNSRYTPNSAYFSSNGNNNIQISNGMDFIERKDYGSTAGKIDICQMPVYYTSKATTADGVKQDVRQQILKNIRTKLDLYRQVYNLPASKDIVSVTPLDQITDLADLSNAYFKVVDRTLPELDTNDAYALNAKNGLHEHKNVNDNGGYDIDTWGTLDISKFIVAKDGTNLEITGYSGDSKNVIIPNIADFWIKGQDQGCSAVEISSSVMKQIAKNAVQIGLSKSNNEKVMAKDTGWFDAFGGNTDGKTNKGDNSDGGIFIFNPNLTKMDLHNFNTSHITNMSEMFNGARNITTLGDLSQWDVSNVTNMKIMFQRAEKLGDLGNLDTWNIANVIDMNHMFDTCLDLQNIGNLSNWNLSTVKDIDAMFQDDAKLSNIGDLSGWDVHNVVDMAYAFSDMNNLISLGDLSKWNTSKVTNMSEMFQADSKLTSLGDIGKWDTSNVTSMERMFFKDSNLNYIGDLSDWNTSKVTNTNDMFYQASSLTTIGDLSNWNMQNNTDMSGMFEQMTNIKDLGNLDNWQTGKVTDMSYMLSEDTQLTNIGNLSSWNTSHVTNMDSMFYNDSKLVNIGNLDNWIVDNVTDTAWMFSDTSSLKNIGNLSKWNTSNISDADHMFYYMTALRNLNISNWDLRSLEDADSFKSFMRGDENLTAIANNIQLPAWYGNELSNGSNFWNNHMAVVTDNVSLLKTKGVYDSIYYGNSDISSSSRPIFYNSNGSSDAVAVITKYDNDYINDYRKNPANRGSAIALMDITDKSDPIALANPHFNYTDLSTIITFVNKTDKDKTVPPVQHISGIGSFVPDIPSDYEFDADQNRNLYYGEDHTVYVHHKIDHNTVNDNATRTFILHLPNGTIQTIVQTIGLTRNQDYDRVIKKIVNKSDWTLVKDKSNVTVDGNVDTSYKAFDDGSTKIRFAPITLLKVPGYRPVIRKNVATPSMFMISFIALPAPADKPRVPSTPAVINKSDNIVVNNNQKDWHIDQKHNTKINYVVTNDQTIIRLPKLENQVLNLIKTSDYTLAFSYLKLNRLNSLIFSVKYNKHGYVLEILADDGKAIKTYHFKTYKDLTKKLIKLNK